VVELGDAGFRKEFLDQAGRRKLAAETNAAVLAELNRRALEISTECRRRRSPTIVAIWSIRRALRRRRLRSTKVRRILPFAFGLFRLRAALIRLMPVYLALHAAKLALQLRLLLPQLLILAFMAAFLAGAWLLAQRAGLVGNQ
jgi:hypothetical protein